MGSSQAAASFLTNIARAAFSLGIGATVLNSSLYTVDGGQRAVLFDRFRGVIEETVGEGTHFLIPWLQKPFIFDIRTRPHTFSSISATNMPTNLVRNITTLKKFAGVVGHCRTYATGGAKKKGSKGAAGDGPKASLLTKEVKSTTVFGANILKDGQDPKLLADSEYPDWLWHLLDKRPALSELRRKDVKALPYEDLKRLVKLDTRARIKENNSLKAKK